MYCQHFRFAEKPFDVTPDPRFLYLSPSHREMLASLVYGIGERRGFITLIGEVGTGKTTLINAALDRLEGSTRVAYICNTALTFDQLLHLTLQELGLLAPGKTISKIEAIHLLNEFTIRQLSERGNVVVIIDEAQNLDTDSMENIRLLSNLETRKHKLIQIVLAGQPELDAKLRRPELRQLAQRISVRRTINPLTENETREYIQHRLNIAHYKGPDLFTGKAHRVIYEYSGGIPRKINILCDNALLIGFALKKRRIDADSVVEAARDLDWKPTSNAGQSFPAPAAEPAPQPTQRSLRPRIALAWGVALAVGLVMAAWITLDWSGLALSLKNRLSSEPAFQTKVETTEDNGARPLAQPFPILAARSDVKPDGGLDNRSKQAVAAPSLEAEPARMQEEPLLPSPAQVQTVAIRSEPPPEQEASLPVSVTAEKTPSPSPTKAVSVKRGDTLFRIITRAYGTCNQGLIDMVVNENQEIASPDRIRVGQVIRLPEVGG